MEQEVRAIGELQERLINAIEGLVEAYEAPSTGEATGVTLKVGPFADTTALRAFTKSLTELPGVETVAVRGFEGTDRAILEVELGSSPGANT